MRTIDDVVTEKLAEDLINITDKSLPPMFSRETKNEKKNMKRLKKAFRTVLWYYGKEKYPYKS
jgi:hypothetical protein